MSFLAFPGMEVWQLPALNAGFNAASVLFLLLAFFFIRRRLVRWHLTCVLMALGSSALFLVSYLFYHFQVGHVPYGGTGGIRWFYFGVLLSHTLLAVLVVPMIVTSIVMAVRGDPRHPKIARLTLATWLYVSVTGVLVFWMLRPYAPSHWEPLRTHAEIPAMFLPLPAIAA
ncbi:putative membrane protein [Gammaproteobacteria bacterium]